MFGMSSKEFWEDDPNLYWAYRTFYYKKLETEQKIQEAKNERDKVLSWLNGNLTCTAVSIALSNAFSKGQPIQYPTYDELFGNEKVEKPLSSDEKQLLNQAEFNTWARVSNIMEANKRKEK